MARTVRRMHADARFAMLQLEAQNAHSTPEQWQELREHMFSEAAGHGTPADDRLEMLTREFDKIRDRALGRRELYMVGDALRAGTYTVAPVGSMMESWTVQLDEDVTVNVLAPASDGPNAASAANVARAALRALRCASCRKGLVRNITGDVVVDHKRRCSAAAVTL